MSPAETVARIQLARDEKAIAAAKIVGMLGTLLAHNQVLACQQYLFEYIAEYDAAAARVLELASALTQQAGAKP